MEEQYDEENGSQEEEWNYLYEEGEWARWRAVLRCYFDSMAHCIVFLGHVAVLEWNVEDVAIWLAEDVGLPHLTVRATVIVDVSQT